jgi:hypothetical protein
MKIIYIIVMTANRFIILNASGMNTLCQNWVGKEDRGSSLDIAGPAESGRLQIDTMTLDSRGQVGSSSSENFQLTFQRLRFLSLIWLKNTILYQQLLLLFVFFCLVST